MDEIDLTKFLGETKPDDLCKIRQHPNRKLVGCDDKRHPASGGTITYSYVCPDCGAEWETVWYTTGKTTVADDSDKK